MTDNIKAMAARQNINRDLLRGMPDSMLHDALCMNVVSAAFTNKERVAGAISTELRDSLATSEEGAEAAFAARDAYALSAEFLATGVVELIGRGGAIRRADLQTLIEGLFPDNKMPAAYDNEGETLDRYTVASYDNREWLVCSADPTYALGVSSIQPHYSYKGGDTIDFWNLPGKVQEHYFSRFGVPCEEE